MKKPYLYIIFLLVVQTSFAQSPRNTIDFNHGWKFFLGNDSAAINENYNDAKWRTLNLPHDWSIESPFLKDAPATNQGGSLPGGIGWYRKTFAVPVSSKDKSVSIEFDGVYRNSEVWINGHYLGKRPHGYISFQYDLSKYLKFGTEKNVIAVKVDNSQQPNSRWYTGSGIYRNVRLVTKNKIAFQENGIYITTQTSGRESQLNIHTVIEAGNGNSELFQVKYTVVDPLGKVVPDVNFHTMAISSLQGNETKELFTYGIKNTIEWSTDKPALYKLKASLLIKGKLVDEVQISFGIHSINFDSENGFFLNNKPLKIHGVCMHHDLGALGAAFNYRAAERQLQILKEMGCNAIRMAHNPPAPEYLDLCDKMGFLVIDEAFDMWQKKKNKFDYALDYKQWHKQDLEDMVLRDRNHPSVIMWSIGNEIREQFDSSAITMTKELANIVKNIDPSRPVMSALTETVPGKNMIFQSGALDVLGFNYKEFDYKYLPGRFPNEKFIASETASALETRGVYQFPSDSIRTWPLNYKEQDTFSTGNKDYTASAYDNTKAYWGNTHERSWLAVKNNRHIAGAFVWSGFDYLGEPLPYPKFPARSSYFGIVDLAGFPKDVYYMYQSEWTTKPVLHIFPHWNWRKGALVDVWAYYNNADEVELFLNGKSLGLRKKGVDELHVMWRVPFEAGTLKAVSRKNNKTVLVKEIKTAGPAAKIELIADRKNIHANNKDLSFITVRITDKDGNVIPDADNAIKFSVSGAAEIAATDNGYQADTSSFVSTARKAWKGLALVIVKSTTKKGNSTLRAESQGLQTGILLLKSTD